MDETQVPLALRDRYEIQAHLGGGVWTDTFQAIERGTRQLRAIKVLKPEHAATPRVRSRFLTEARAMTRIVHPHVIRIFDVGAASGEEPAIVMEFAERGGLRRNVPRGGLPAATAVRVALQLLSGLAAAHDVGIVHRDVQPDSVLVDQHGNVKLTDFGVARLERNPKVIATMTSESLGAYLYAAPEQRKNARDVDVRADVYGVAATLSYLLHGKDPMDLAVAGFRDGYAQKVHPVLGPIILQAAAMEPEERYPDVRALDAALRAVLPQLG